MDGALENYWSKLETDDEANAEGGVVYAHAATTVDPSYAKEILTPEGGEGRVTDVQGSMIFTGILNGSITGSTTGHRPLSERPFQCRMLCGGQSSPTRRISADHPGPPQRRGTARPERV